MLHYRGCFYSIFESILSGKAKVNTWEKQPILLCLTHLWQYPLIDLYHNGNDAGTGLLHRFTAVAESFHLRKCESLFL